MIIDSSKNLETQLSRCDGVIEHAGALLKYEHNQIPTINPKPSELIGIYGKKKDELIYNALNSEAGKLIQETNYVNYKTQINKLSKVFLKISEYKNRYSEDINDINYINLVSLGNMVRIVIDDLNIHVMLDEAQKAELKKQNKKALDKYFDALYYYMNHENIKDPLQKEKIDKVKGKIIELGGEVPEILSPNSLT